MSYARNKRKKMKARMRKYGIGPNEAAQLNWNKVGQQAPRRKD